MTRINNMEKMKYSHIGSRLDFWKSVISQNLCKSVIQTSYDIVKAHGGELKVDSREGNGTEIFIQL